MFDIMKYKENIIDAARNSSSMFVSIDKGSLRGDYEPMLYVDVWSYKDGDKTVERFLNSLCHTIEEDVDWTVTAMPTDIVRSSGVLLLEDGEWCYG